MAVIDDFYTPSRTKPRLLQTLLLIGLVRYCLPEQLRLNKPFLQHTATKKALNLLVDIGYLNVLESGVLHLTDTAFRLLQAEGCNIKHLQKTFQAEYGMHELQITDYILKLTDKPEFFTAFYPAFKEPPDYRNEYLRPDACLVFKKDNLVKIEFLEMENPKFKQEHHILGKMRKYETIARDFNTYDKFFRGWFERIELPYCNVEDFCFSINIVRLE